MGKVIRAWLFHSPSDVNADTKRKSIITGGMSARPGAEPRAFSQHGKRSTAGRITARPSECKKG